MDADLIRVLIADDEPGMRMILRKMIDRVEGFTLVGEAADGAELMEKFTALRPQVVFLDVDMPVMNGVACANQIQDEDPTCVLIFATAHEEYRSDAFAVYAFDYLVKPFEFAELLARLRALGRRSTQKIQQDVVEVGAFTLNRTAKVLKKKDQVIQLSPREFQIFDLLAQNIGIVVPRDIILDRIWGLESDVSSNNIDSYMKILRKKLDIGDGQSVIKTVRGVGYKLEAGA